jgi:hypothetical protein
MKLTKLSAAPGWLPTTVPTEVPPRARAGRMDAGTASQLIRGVLRTSMARPTRLRSQEGVVGWTAYAEVAVETREQLTGRTCDPALLARLYSLYNPLADAEAFVARALDMFPRLCCGLASVYLRHCLGEGTVAYGSYEGERHTFLATRGCILDITADQFGGPEIYVGRLGLPWSLGPGRTARRADEGGRRTSG